MLVAIAGSQGCGKSTLINELKKDFKTIDRKTSRSILNDWGVTLGEVNNNPELTLKFQDEMVERKRVDEQSQLFVIGGPPVITERTYIDLATYALVALGKDNQYSDWLDTYVEKCAKLQQTYDVVFYLKSGHFSIEHDGVRGANAHYSRMVDLVMFDMMQQFTLPERFIVIDTPILRQRVVTITNFIRALYNKQPYPFRFI